MILKKQFLEGCLGYKSHGPYKLKYRVDTYTHAFTALRHENINIPLFRTEHNNLSSCRQRACLLTCFCLQKGVSIPVALLISVF